MPVRDDARFIAESLEAILAQDYPRNRMDIVVAEGRSSDGSREIIEQFERLDTRLRVVDNPWGHTPAGLNAAIRRATGEFLVRVDSRAVVAPDYVRSCVEALLTSGADVAGGLQRPTGRGSVASAIAAAMTCPFGVGNAAFRYAKRARWTESVYLGAYRREVFERLGLFDEELLRNQDDELHFRLWQSGGRLWLDPAIRSVYRCRETLGELWRQYFDYGEYKVRVMEKRGVLLRWRHLVPPTFVVTMILCTLLFAGTFNLAWLAPHGLYLSSSALAATWHTRLSNVSPALVSAAWAVMHFGYGLGLLGGLCQRARL